ncbi:MAG: amidohydrolase family protein [Bryobacterales bacterium]|nr:amidohydrolase family protein [Bryobacterales bacterium]
MQYTMGSAYASFEEREKGSVEVGKAADFAVLSEDILEIPASRIDRVKVVLTVVDGHIVFRGK